MFAHEAKSINENVNGGNMNRVADWSGGVEFCERVQVVLAVNPHTIYNKMCVWQQ